MIPELLPKAGKTTVQIPADATFSSKQNKKSTSQIMTNNNPDLLPEWKPLDPRFIQLRSKHYLTHSDKIFKTKEENLKLSSDVSLYECIALDIFDNDEDFDSESNKENEQNNNSKNNNSSSKNMKSSSSSRGDSSSMNKEQQ